MKEKNYYLERDNKMLEQSCSRCRWKTRQGRGYCEIYNLLKSVKSMLSLCNYNKDMNRNLLKKAINENFPIALEGIVGKRCVQHEFLKENVFDTKILNIIKDTTHLYSENDIRNECLMFKRRNNE